MVDYSDTIEVHGVRVPFVPEIITPKIERPMRRGKYEQGEVELMRAILRSGDRLLELGAGLGVVSSTAAQVEGVERILSVEADPQLIPLIEETWRLNGIQNAEIQNGVAMAKTGAPVNFYVRPNFWASSMEPDSRPYSHIEEVPSAGMDTLIDTFRPTVLSCDIEGGELGLLDEVDLSGLRHIVMEVHPKVYGQEGLRTIVDKLAEQGFLPSVDAQQDSTVKRFDRIDADAPVPADHIMPRRRFAATTPDKPRILLPTCMKNEGPFILEWLAWHRAIGVTDFVIYTNDCTDGTDVLLEHLQKRGLLRHMPNPALVASGSPSFQPKALTYSHYLPEFANVDYVLSMDVDEFINVRVGDGTLTALLEAAGDFDVLSMSEINHGCNGHAHFTPGLLTEQFPNHQTEAPGDKRAQRGVKSLVRLSPRIEKVRNHRPDVRHDLGAVLWRDGSARLRHDLAEDPTANGWDCRGSYDLVSLDHFPLRALDSFLVKMHRGDVVVMDKKVSRRYWRVRNHSQHDSSDLTQGRARMQSELDTLLSDPETRRLHDACIAAHQARIATLSREPEYQERKAWIYNEAWRDPYPEEAAEFLWDTADAPQDD